MKLATLIFLFFFTAHVYACKCGDIPAVAESVNHSDIVFSGHVLSKTRTTDYRSKITITGDTTSTYHRVTYYPMYVIRIKLVKVYKGQTSSDTLTVITGPNGASCGFNFEVDKNYIIYGFNSNRMLSSGNYSIKARDNTICWAHQCTRTNYFSAEEEAHILLATKK